MGASPSLQQLLQSPEMRQLLRALPSLPPDLQREVVELVEPMMRDEHGWPITYINSETKRAYRPHHPQELEFVYSFDTWRNGASFGGEGGGKTVCSAIKCLERLKRGCNGMLVSPNLTHFQRSTWKEFRLWCPWDLTLPSCHKMADADWIPYRPFDIYFQGNNWLHCVGAKDVGSLEGANLNFCAFDEARHFPDASAVKVLSGRVRIPGSNGERPQMWFSTTKPFDFDHWLFTYFGPLRADCPECQEPVSAGGLEGISVQMGKPFICPICGCDNLAITDEQAAFKLDSSVISLPTAGNIANLSDGFVADRAQPLTEAEILVLLEDEWREVAEGQPFLPDMSWWDSCREDLPPISDDEHLVLVLDAATGRQVTSSDCFAVLALTRHPDPSRADTDVAVRYTHTWQARPGHKIDFQGSEDNPGPERTIRHLCAAHRVLAVVFDPTQLHDMSTRLSNELFVWFLEFTQGTKRWEADRHLYDLIVRGGIAHDGDRTLRRHIQNADRRLDSVSRKMRLEKRTDSQRIDLAVCLSMGAHAIMELNV